MYHYWASIDESHLRLKSRIAVLQASQLILLADADGCLIFTQVSTLHVLLVGTFQNVSQSVTSHHLKCLILLFLNFGRLQGLPGGLTAYDDSQQGPLPFSSETNWVKLFLIQTRTALIENKLLFCPSFKNASWKEIKDREQFYLPRTKTSVASEVRSFKHRAAQRTIKALDWIHVSGGWVRNHLSSLKAVWFINLYIYHLSPLAPVCDPEELSILNATLVLKIHHSPMPFLLVHLAQKVFLWFQWNMKMKIIILRVCK